MKPEIEKIPGNFVAFPAPLLTVLSDTAIRILLYAMDREGLVTLGYFSEWQLSLSNISNQFGEFKGYSVNTVRNGIRQLRKLNLLIPRGNYYDLNHEELKKWYLKERGYQNLAGLPKTGSGGLPNSGRGGVPNSGSQEKRSTEKKSTKEESTKVPGENPATKASGKTQTVSDSSSTHSGAAVKPTPVTDSKRPLSDSAPATPGQHPQPSSTVPAAKKSAADRKRMTISGQLYTEWLAGGKRGPWPPPNLEEQVARRMK